MHISFNIPHKVAAVTDLSFEKFPLSELQRQLFCSKQNIILENCNLAKFQRY